MNSFNSSGPDGFPPAFYQNHWSFIGKEVSEAALHVVNSDGLVAKINETHMVLIPKIKSPSKVTNFRPISLYNVLYKIIQKTLANTLKKILPQMISHTQSVFVPDRLISTNVIVPFEAMHTMNSKLIGKSEHMTLKLDMSKAYD